MFKDVPKADVVLVNPVHIAVALKYDPSVAPAPYVVAVGRRKVAERIKTIAFEDAVNVTLGLPFIRTSPDHGTAFDIAGTGKANPSSLAAALRLAARMATTKPS